MPRRFAGNIVGGSETNVISATMQLLKQVIWKGTWRIVLIATTLTPSGIAPAAKDLMFKSTQKRRLYKSPKFKNLQSGEEEDKNSVKKWLHCFVDKI